MKRKNFGVFVGVFFGLATVKQEAGTPEAAAASGGWAS